MLGRRSFFLLFLPVAPILLFGILTIGVWRLRTVQLDPHNTMQGTVVAADNSIELPTTYNTGIQSEIEKGDARAEIVASFLERHDSPLTPYDHYGRALVETADRYNLDYRLLPAIMMQESNLCKSIIPGSNNCLGFGIHERGTLTFESYEASFDRAARELKQRYVDIGLTTPEDIMKKYTPSSNGSWAFSVNQWIVEMEYNDREHARENRTNNNLLEYTDK
jgi:hypothetical protein